MAGIWERWHDLDTFCIITTDAAPSIATLHDRMPVIVPRQAWSLWLDPDAAEERLERLLQPYDALRYYAVSNVVGSPRNDDASCIAPLG